MKKTLTIILVLLMMHFSPAITTAQSYQFGSSFINGVTISTCSGVFYDSGGAPSPITTTKIIPLPSALLALSTPISRSISIISMSIIPILYLFTMELTPPLPLSLADLTHFHFLIAPIHSPFFRSKPMLPTLPDPLL